MAKPLERLAALEANVVDIRADVAEIKCDVKKLLETKWRNEGKIVGVSAVISAIVSGIAIFFGGR